MADLVLRNVYKVYNDGTVAVNNFNLDIANGEFLVLVGPSGCGKSTTLRMIAGLEDITAGSFYINDKKANALEPKDRNMAMVFQNYALYPHMNVYENMAFGLRINHVPKDIIDQRVKKAAAILGLETQLAKKPKDMSGGQRQRVALGRAIVREPSVFLLDEPLSNLDAKLRASMRNEIVKLHEKVKTTFVYVTHDQIEAMTMGDRIVVMKDGVIQQVGTPSEIYDNPQNLFVAGFIGTPQMNFFDVSFKAGAKDAEIILPNGASIKHKLNEFKDIQDEYVNGEEKNLVLGVRPEHISIDKKGIEAVVNFVEILGNTTNIICKLANGENEFSISVQERSELASGDTIHVNFDIKNCHLFDKETEVSIYKRGSEE